MNILIDFANTKWIIDVQACIGSPKTYNSQDWNLLRQHNVISFWGIIGGQEYVASCFYDKCNRFIISMKANQLINMLVAVKMWRFRNHILISETKSEVGLHW